MQLRVENSRRTYHAWMIATHWAAFSGEKAVVRAAGDSPGSIAKRFVSAIDDQRSGSVEKESQSRDQV
jgi:hypothetical protein